MLAPQPGGENNGMDCTCGDHPVNWLPFSRLTPCNLLLKCRRTREIQIINILNLNIQKEKVIEVFRENV